MLDHGELDRSRADRQGRHRGRAWAAVFASSVMAATLLAGNTAAQAAPGSGQPVGESEAVGFTPERAQARDSGTEENGLRIDARSYAKDYRVSVAEATARLVAQEEYAQLVARVAEAYPGSFAGSDIDHGKNFGLRLYFTGDATASAVERAVGSARLSRPSVRIDTSAKLNLAESTALVEAVDIPDRLDGRVNGLSYDAATNTVTLDVVSTVTTTLRAEPLLDTAVAQAAETLDMSAPTIAVNSQPLAAFDAHSGGLHLSSCTSGFAVSVGGTEGITTAGHCGNSQEYKNYCCTNWWPLFYQSEARTATADVQWHTTRIGVFPRFIASSETTYRPVNGRVLRSGQQGHYICHRGKTTGYSCGVVQDNAYRLTYANACPGTTCAATWVRTTGASLACFGGDSGGVVFNAYNAYGLLKGGLSSGTSPGNCSEMYHMPIDYLSGIGATLLTE